LNKEGKEGSEEMTRGVIGGAVEALLIGELLFIDVVWLIIPN
jgi:hypothetical protein